MFGSRCHVHVPKEKQGKLDAHSLDRIFCSFTPKSKAYKIWIPSCHKFVTSRDVIVYEKLPKHEGEPIATSTPSEGVSQDQGTLSVGATEPTANESATNPQADPELEKYTIPKPTPTAETTIQPCRSECTTQPTWIKAMSNLQKAAESKLRANNKALHEACTEHHELKAKAKLQLPNMEEPHSHSPSPATPVTETEIANFTYLATHGSITLLSYKEAIRSPESVEWNKAMRAEIDNHTQWCMWELVPLPKGQKAIGSQWTYSIKFNSDGSITHYKACLVAQGFSQVIGIDYYDTFAPTVQLETVHTLLHLTAAHSQFRGQDDVVAAFLFGDLEEEIFMRQLEGFEDGTNRVAKLLQSLYSLKQAVRVWNKHLHKELVAVGYLQLISDSAVYIRKADHITILVIHVNNIISFRSGKSSLDDACVELHWIFEMKEEDPNWLMGFKLIENCNEGTIAIDHSLYIDTILQRFGMENCNPTYTPLDLGTLLSTDDCPTTEDEKAAMMNVPYRELIGALTWITVVSRLDIAFTTTYLARFNANPGPTHWKAAKHVLWYLNSMKQHYLTLGLQSGNSNKLTIFTDSDWGCDIINRCSVSGYVFMLGDLVISWKAKQQPTVAASSTEVEYMSVSQTAHQGLWIRRLLIELGLNHIELDPTTMFLDNCGTVNLSKGSHHHDHTKHIDIQHHFICEHIEDGTFHIIHCPTHLMLANALTKPLPFPTFSHCRDGLGLISN